MNVAKPRKVLKNEVKSCLQFVILFLSIKSNSIVYKGFVTWASELETSNIFIVSIKKYAFIAKV